MLPFFRRLAVPEVDLALRPRFSAGQLAWGFVALGVAVRLIRYLLCFPLWIDECLLAENLLDRGYLDLLRPLMNDQVAPVGFLWLQLALTRLFGFSEWSLRLVPLCSGIAALVLFRHLASRLFRRATLVLAVACLAVAKAPIGLSTDAKPYASDLLIAVAMMTAVVEWLRRPDRHAWLWGLACASPVAILVSLPAVFVAGGASLALAIPVWKTHSRQARCAWLLLNALTVVAFALLLSLNVTEQYRDKQDFMVRYWTSHLAFPAWSSLSDFASWLLQAHTGEKLLAYPYGAKNGGSLPTLVCCAVAAIAMVRRGQRNVLAIFLAPAALLFVAATLERYPYSGHIRLTQFLAPGICAMAGLGAAVLAAKLPHVRWRRAAMGTLCVLLGAFGVGLSVRDFVRPWDDVDDPTYRTFTRALWSDDDGVTTLCAKTDFCQEFCDVSGYSVPYAYYRCYQRLYSPSHRVGACSQAGNLAVSQAPIRLVVYQPPQLRLDRTAVRSWLQEFGDRFYLIGPETHTVKQTRLKMRLPIWDRFGTFEVYRLEPRNDHIGPPLAN